ncbi:hypothetical protein [Hufsiella ginkgonis]|uniref:Uncharacterized protein n=1 Tax=Hufsiella ginkgonis TaxID=2695274 RepID=A0A7K1Y0B3_9SPHI|nr:hypothetical protein [Hufsiella ginkgonis]MXV16721.1 hypothetical protein [Hufsiella ginkgonis]
MMIITATRVSAGDYVRHIDPRVNGGLEMFVNEVSGRAANCDHFSDDPDPVLRQDWFPVKDLVLVREAEPGLV